MPTQKNNKAIISNILLTLTDRNSDSGFYFGMTYRFILESIFSETQCFISSICSSSSRNNEVLVPCNRNTSNPCSMRHGHCMFPLGEWQLKQWDENFYLLLSHQKRAISVCIYSRACGSKMIVNKASFCLAILNW